jgi:hypothetical protein
VADGDKPQAPGQLPGGRPASPLTIWALALIAPVVTFIGTMLPRYYMTDFWHHLARGRAMVESGALVDDDRFTYTVAGQPLRDPNWLSQIIFYRLYEAGGLPLVRTVNSLVLATAIGVLVFLCWRASGSLLLATLLGLWTFFGLMQLFIVRPQTFSFLLFAVLLACLVLSEQRRAWLLAAPVVQALWVNMHGIFPIGFVLIGAFALAALWDGFRSGRWARFRDLSLCLAAAVLATGINPYGFKIYLYVGTTTASAAARGIMEWQPPGLNLLTGKLWVASILLLLVAFSLSARRPSARDWCLVLIFLPPTFGAIRMVGWWYLVSMPIVAAQFGPLLARIPWPVSQARPSPVLGGVCLGLVGLAAAISLPGVRNRLGREPVPVESALEVDLEKVAVYLGDRPKTGRYIFCRFEWGEYLGWALQPDGYRVFMDGRIEIIPDKVWDEYIALFNGRGDWQEILDKYGVSILVLDAGDPDSGRAPDNLFNLAAKSRRWMKVYETDGRGVVVFVRK